MSTWVWISGRREREVILKSMDHLEYVYKTVFHLGEMLNKIQKLELENALSEYDKINKYEEEADRIKREIIGELSKGNIHPMDREDLLRLIFQADDIAAHAKASGRRLKLLTELGYDIPDQLLSLLINMVVDIVKMVDMLREAISQLTRNPRKSLEITHVIEDIEEKVDDVRLEALRLIFRTCSGTFDSKCVLYKEIVDNIENTADKCEDTGDLIRSISLAHLQ
ncbi:MAG: DUF47 family protein [Staphylothermus sp.]|nr:DUF47 family protein [Staphylothermus sp.]